ncbi:hypothetical protein [Azospirillum sp. sgz302134]
MRSLFLLAACAALLSGSAMAGEIVILDSGGPTHHHGKRVRNSVVIEDPLTGDSLFIIERPSREEELGRRDPGLEARRAARRAHVKRRSKDLPDLDELSIDGVPFLDRTVPFGLGRGDPGREAARAAADARRMRLER